MRWILAIVGALLGALAGEEEGLFIGLGVGMLIGWVIEREQRRASFVQQRPSGALGASGESFEQRASTRIVELSERVARLERTVAELSLQRAAQPVVAAGSTNVESGAPDAALGAPPAEPDERGYPRHPAPEGRAAKSAGQLAASEARLLDESASGSGALMASSQVATAEQGAASASSAPREAATDAAVAAGAPRSPSTVNTKEMQAPTAPARVVSALRELLLGGNTVVRIGILVLTVGLGLLAKYAAEQAYFPLELRLAFAAATGIALIVVGYRLHLRRPDFGSALQGGGVAALYLVTFFAFYSYELLPAWLTLPLLVAIAALSSLLAVAQNAQQLAVFGALGGFLAPVLASRGGGSHVALFSYYALLNAALSGIALFRSWRILNWTGFVFTFGIASAWGALQYEPDDMATASAFLALFFAFYVTNGSLFALRQPGARRGIIDTTLTFGTPLATLGLASGLFHEQPLYLALACAAMAAVYLASARALLSRKDAALATLARAYVALGVGVATLAIPFALESALATALAWAVEASGLVWVGCRQARLRTRIAGYALFIAASFALLARVADASHAGGALFCALMALALGFAAACLDRHRGVLRAAEPYVGHALFGLGLLLYLGALHLLALAPFVPHPLHDLAILTLLAASVLGLDLLGEHCAFTTPRRAARFALPYLLLNLPGVLPGASHPFASYAWAGWLAAIVAAYWVLDRQRDVVATHPTLLTALHASGGWLVAALLAIEANFAVQELLALAEGWVDGLTLTSPLALVVAALWRKPSHPIAEQPRAYAKWSAWPIAWIVCVSALFCQAQSSGSAAPLPYLPLLNPLDLAHALALALLLSLARDEAVRSVAGRRLAVWGSAASAFVMLNATVVRTAHHWAGVPFVPWQVPSDPLVQASFSILWTLLALVAMVASQRSRRRALWVVGAVLLACVVLKLFLLDLAALGSVTKIVTFLAVGVLLLLVGYFAPVPPARALEETPR